ncbi:MAG: helix-turn-helix transcriptional regulator [Tardiphaga sp.]
MRTGRALLGWSQDDLARRAGVQRQVVSSYENGTRTPHPANLECLVRALREAGVTEITKRDGSAGVIATARTLLALRFGDPDGD